MRKNYFSHEKAPRSGGVQPGAIAERCPVNKESAIVKQKSFTLIEIMLVVIIISILAAMLIPRLAGRAEKARRAVTEAEIESNIPSALDLYEMDTGAYPEKLEDLISAPANLDGWDGPYIKKMPKDSWGKPYFYKCPGEHNKDYDLASSGRDRVIGTDDDIKNWE